MVISVAQPKEDVNLKEAVDGREVLDN